MKHEGIRRAGEVGKFGDHRDCRAKWQVKRVLPSGLVGRHGTVAAQDDLELHIVNVERVAEDGVVDDRSLLDGTKLDRMIDERVAERLVVEGKPGSCVAARDRDGAGVGDVGIGPVTVAHERRG